MAAALARLASVDSSLVRKGTAPTAHRWPEDYVLMDKGRLYVRRDFVPILESMGWTSLHAVLNSHRCHVMRRVGNRENAWIDLPRPSSFVPPPEGTPPTVTPPYGLGFPGSNAPPPGSTTLATAPTPPPGSSRLAKPPASGAHAALATVRSYLKRHRRASVSQWLAARVGDRLYGLPGLAEAEAVGRCQSADVPTLSVVAAGGEVGPSPGQSPSFFLSEDVGGVPADDFWKKRMGPPGDPRSRLEDRRALLATLADVARGLHRAGLFHRDFYWCHFFVQEPSAGRFQVALIDLQRVLHCPRRGLHRLFNSRWRLKDLAQFRFSAPPKQLSSDEMNFWFRAYCNESRLRPLQHLAQRAVDLRAWFYQWKDGLA
ncbi:MAG: lipopolysaccharide kinase InaA family protein [Planctomycetia bacterium]